MIKILDRHLSFVKDLLSTEDDEDKLTIHLSPQREGPPYTFHIKVRDIWIPVTAIVTPMEGSTIEIDTSNGEVTVVALPDSIGDNESFGEILQRPSRLFNYSRSAGWKSRSETSTDDQ